MGKQKRFNITGFSDTPGPGQFVFPGFADEVIKKNKCGHFNQTGMSNMSGINSTKDNFFAQTKTSSFQMNKMSSMESSASKFHGNANPIVNESKVELEKENENEGLKLNTINQEINEVSRKNTEYDYIKSHQENNRKLSSASKDLDNKRFLSLNVDDRINKSIHHTKNPTNKSNNSSLAEEV